MLTKEKLKEKLLALSCFEDNEYFDKYIELCVNNANTKKTKYMTNEHHIILRKYYKFNKLEIDNSPENLVNLYHYDHILAHYYLVLCSIPEYLRYANAAAFVMLVGNEKRITPDEIAKIKDLNQYNIVYENYSGKPKTAEHRAALVKARGFRNTTKGKKSVYNKELGIVKFIDTTEVEEYLQKGWSLGGKPMSEEAKRKISASNSIALLGKVHDKNKKENAIFSGLVGAKVQCVETGQIFENVAQAKLWLYTTTGVDGGHIKDCCCGHRKVTGGYHWKYYAEG